MNSSAPAAERSVLLVRPRDPLTGTRHTRIRTLTLATVAQELSQVGPVRVVDEAQEALPDGPFRLVGITSDTPHAPRALALAQALRRRGETVLMGGTHVTALPEEALRHCHAVVIGEIEGLGRRIADDLSAGKLGGQYRLDSPPDLARMPVPDVDLLPHYRQHLQPYPMELTRGCKHACRFCFNRYIHGSGFRRRDLDALVQTIAGRREPFLLCMDDNLMNDPDHLANFADKVAPLGRVWGGQSTLEIADDPVLLRHLKDSGFSFTFAGLESFSPSSLAGEGKGFNRVERYSEQLGRLREFGVVPFLGLMLGLDGDGPDIFQRTQRALRQLGPAACAVTMPVAYPGTRFFRQMEDQGRVLTHDLALYDGRHVVLRPLRMTPQELWRGYNRLARRFYSPRAILARLPRYALTSMNMGRVQRLLGYLALSFGYWQFHRQLARRSWDAPGMAGAR